MSSGLRNPVLFTMMTPIQSGAPPVARLDKQEETPAPRPSSLDRVELARWRFSSTNGFVVKDYTGLESGQEPAILVVKASEIFEVMADAAEHHKKISVYAIGPCVLDLS